MTIAVVIPCYNVEAHIATALDSVLAQQHADLDILCVDDGSTDRTPEILKEYHARTRGRVRVHRQHNKGACAARNEGLVLTRGEWIQFLDADDVLKPGKIHGQLDLVDGRADAILVAGSYEKVMPNGLLLPVEPLLDEPWMALIKTRLGTTSANLWHRASVQAAGGWSETLGSSQDYDLMFRMMMRGGRVLFDPRIETSVLKRASGSISQSEPKGNWVRYIELRHTMREHLRKIDPQRHHREIDTLDQYIFMALRVLAQYDLDEAIDTYRRIIPRGFVPEESRAITSRYVRFHRLLGFAATERLASLVRKGAQA